MRKRILNLGCGSDTYGTDFVDTYPLNPRIKKCTVGEERFPYSTGTFDEVYSRCLLEHLKNPYNALKEMVRVLKPGGKLMIITDNAGWWAFHTPFSTVHYGGYEKNRAKKYDKHYSLFTAWHIRNHLVSLNLNNIEVRYVLVKEKTPQLLVRAISYIINFVGLSRIAYPNIVAEATK